MNETTIAFDPEIDGLTFSERARQIELIEAAGWTLTHDTFDRATIIATCPYDMASWDVAAAFCLGLGISERTWLAWEPADAMEDDPVHWPIGDPERSEVEAAQGSPLNQV